MATYVMSDIHGEYDLFLKLLKKIDLKDDDTLYVLGDVLDRGPHPIKILKKLMKMPNVICIVGNHELMAIECLEFLMKEISGISIDELDMGMLNNLVTWQYNGSKTTIDEFKLLSYDEKLEVVEFIKDFLLYKEISIGDKEYLLVHAGLGGFVQEKDIDDYSIHDLVWSRPDYNKKYFDDTFVVTGHTPTQLIKDNDNPGYIYKKNNHIAIDCGACFTDGRLAAICLDTGEEFYSS